MFGYSKLLCDYNYYDYWLVAEVMIIKKENISWSIYTLFGTFLNDISWSYLNEVCEAQVRQLL